MSFCRACGNGLVDGDEYCTKCGLAAVNSRTVSAQQEGKTPKPGDSEETTASQSDSYISPRFDGPRRPPNEVASAMYQRLGFSMTESGVRPIVDRVVSLDGAPNPIQSRDEILRVDGKSIRNRQEIFEILTGFDFNQPIKIELSRNGRQMEFILLPSTLSRNVEVARTNFKVEPDLPPVWKQSTSFPPPAGNQTLTIDPESADTVRSAERVASFLIVTAWVVLALGFITALVTGYDDSHASIAGHTYAIPNSVPHFIAGFVGYFGAACVGAAMFAFFGYLLKLNCLLVKNSGDSRR